VPLNRADALNDRRLGLGNFTLLVGNYGASVGDALEEFMGAQQERLVTRLAEALVTNHESLVDQYATMVQRGQQQRKAGTKEIIGHHDRIEMATGIGPRALLQICFTGRYSFCRYVVIFNHFRNERLPFKRIL